MSKSKIAVVAIAGFIVADLTSPILGESLRVPENFPTIQSCIEAATSGVDECIVAAGVYHEAINYLGKGISVRSAEGPKVTIIDATGLGSSVVTCINGEDSSAVLEGFAITGGTGTLFAGDVSGGGMLNLGSPTIIDCVFQGNTAHIGGGMYNHILSQPTLVGCSFMNNSAHFGAGMGNLQSSPTLIDCSFIGNSAAGGGGGAIGSQLYSTPTLTNCLFRENDAYLGGALYNDWDCNPTIVNCTFVNNTAFRGGGIFNSLDSVPILENCEFSGNLATGDGGAIYDEEYSGVLATGCTFDGNTALDWGGAMDNGPWNFIPDRVTFVDCIFRNNKAGSGGGFFNEEWTYATLRGCTFEENTAVEGGGIYNNDGADLSLIDCRFTHNSATDGGGELNVGSTSLVGCIFEQNVASDSGGGISNTYMFYAGSISARDTSFQDNKAHDGGGIYSEGGLLTLTRCDFNQNQAHDGGGVARLGSSGEVNDCRFLGNHADQNGGGAISFEEDGQFRNCLFHANDADQGGGVYNFGSIRVSFQDCVFENNTALGGAAMLHDGVIEALVMRGQFQGNRARSEGGAVFGATDNSTYVDCLFSGNTAPYGAAIGTYGTTSTILGCTLVENIATESGGAVYESDSNDLSVADSVFWGNRPDQIAFDVTPGTIQFSDIDGGVPEGMIDGGANIDLDPMFLRIPDPGADGNWDGVDDDYGDLRLRAGSPCINSGDPTFAPLTGESDLDGHTRILCSKVEMGAYEFGIGDANCDDVVNAADFAKWSPCVTGPGAEGGGHLPPDESACAAFDFDGNSAIDLSDFAQFANLMDQ